MPRFRRNDAARLETEAIPPFWLQTDDSGTIIIDPPVYDVARANWHWAFYQVSRDLRDGTRTPEIVQHVAVEVTKRLRDNAAVGENLGGYFRSAIIRHVRTLAIREGRIMYQGSSQDLEASYQPPAPDSTHLLHDRMRIKALIPFMPQTVRLMLHYRLLDYTWEQTAQRVGLTVKQAKSRFYYGVHQANLELLEVQARRAHKGEVEECK
jgi:hypothetical protein